MPNPVIRGRGASSQPPGRFPALTVERDSWTLREDPAPETRLLRDRSRSVISWNDSPDLGHDAGLNPYRGCEHGCAYCYARPGHEYLGFSAGLDFETRIVVKERAPGLLRRQLSSKGWRPRPLLISGVTDAYQPAERRLGLTRRCLAVLAEFRNPVAVITKSHLVARDADLLSSLATHEAAVVTLSITTLDPGLQRALEPRAAAPSRRLDAIRALVERGVPARVNVAPVIPALTDHELPSILEAAADAGATSAGYIMLRLPDAVAGIFEDWLRQHVPGRATKVLGRVRMMRGGRLNDPRFFSRQRGEGAFANQTRDLFAVTCRRLGLATKPPPLSVAAFRRPGAAIQGELFGG